MKIMFVICVVILIFAVLTYNKWSYKAWYERCVKSGTGYDWDGNFYDHNKGLVYYKDGSVEKIDYQNLNKNRRKHKKVNMKKIEYYNMLKPCPKCGSKHLRVTHWKTIGVTTRFAIDCYDCDYKIEGRSRRRVLKKWGIHQPQSARGNRSKIIERFD